MSATAAAHPERRVELWFMDEARVGQKGRVRHRWWLKGRRPPGVCDRRYDWAWIFGTVRPACGDAFALVLPDVSTEAMQTFLDAFAARLAPDVQAVVVLDQAGWHGAKALHIPETVTLVPLPPLFARTRPSGAPLALPARRFLSLRLFPDDDAIVDTCCRPWNALAAETARIASLCNDPWIKKLKS
ncbi:MAG: transposase [Rhodospirillales bacterium]|nr:transposase [Rhodospirillales bacterium]